MGRWRPLIAELDAIPEKVSHSTGFVAHRLSPNPVVVARIIR